MSSAVTITTFKPIPVAEWESFAADLGLTYSPATIGGNYWYTWQDVQVRFGSIAEQGGAEGIPAQAAVIHVSTYAVSVGGDVLPVIELANAIRARWQQSTFRCDPELEGGFPLMRCVVPGCKYQRAHYPVIEMRAPFEYRNNAPIRVILNLPTCEGHIEHVTLDNVLSDDAWNRITAQIDRLGRVIPDRDRAVLEWMPYDAADPAVRAYELGNQQSTQPSASAPINRSVIVWSPGEAPKVEQWEEVTSKALRARIGQNLGIAFTMPTARFDDRIAALCDDDGILTGLPITTVRFWDGVPLAGTLVIVAERGLHTGGRYDGLTPADIDLFERTWAGAIPGFKVERG